MTQYKGFEITANIEECYVEKLHVLAFNVSSHRSYLTKSYVFPVTFGLDFMLISPVIFDCDII